MGKKRIDYIDIAKGLGMMTIIWGHIMYAGISNAIVYAFHIPLYFFLSGLVFSRERYASFGEFVMKRVKGLLFPYIIFSFLTWVLWAAFAYVSHAQVNSYWMPLLQTFIAQGSDGYLIHNVPLWFVTCLFVVEVAYYYLWQLKDWANMLFCIALAILGYVLVNDVEAFDFTTLPWSIEVAMMAIPFYAAGNMLLKHLGHEKILGFVKKHGLATVAIVVLTAIGIYFGAKYNGAPSMGHANLGANPFVFYGTAILGIVAFMGICIGLSFIQSGGVLSYIKWFGKNSFRVMALHNPIKGVVMIVVAKLCGIVTGTINSSAGYAAVTFVLTVLVTTVVVWLIGWFLQKTLGRNSILK